MSERPHRTLVGPSSVGSTTVSLSSYPANSYVEQSVSCKLDKENGSPIIAPLDNLEQVSSP